MDSVSGLMTSGAGATVWAGAVGALMVGISGSVHCLLMCGPLACATLPLERGPSRRRAQWAYQGARVAGYTLMGALLGGLGGGVGRALSVSVQPLLPWIMAAGLVATALDLGKRLRPLPGVSRMVARMGSASARFSPTARAATLGGLTPLLPCGLLYGVMAAALASGSFAGGALIASAFALGGLPALLGAQVGAGMWRNRPPVVEVLLRRVLPVAAAVILIVRAVQMHVAEAGAPPACH